jgi:hypothetical protein
MTTLNLLIRRWLTRRQIETIMAVAGICVLSTLALLWFSDSVPMFKAVLAFSLGCILLIVWCVKLLEMEI